MSITELEARSKCNCKGCRDCPNHYDTCDGKKDIECSNCGEFFDKSETIPLDHPNSSERICEDCFDRLKLKL